MKDLLNIKYWLFDLDNTLYSGDTKVFDQVDKRMSKYISDKLNVSIDEAKKIQKNYFHEYNTTLNGMIKNHEINAQEFLDFVHDIDLEFLKNDKGLELELSKIKDKKIIFTNGSRAHAENVTKRIGINKLFDGIFDIVDSDFIPKPAIPSSSPVINKLIDPLKFLFSFLNLLTAATKHAIDAFISFAPRPINLLFLTIGLNGLVVQFFTFPGGTTSVCPA